MRSYNAEAYTINRVCGKREGAYEMVLYVVAGIWTHQNTFFSVEEIASPTSICVSWVAETLKGSIFYCGSCPVGLDWVIASACPWTSSRTSRNLKTSRYQS